MSKTAPRPRSAAALAAVVLAVVAVVLLTGPAGRADVAVDDLTQLGAASAATLACARTGRRTGGRRRQAWTAMAVGCGGWAAGQAVWSWYELALAVATPFPSPGDLGFLTFPVAATVALLLHPARSRAPGQGRRSLLDGVLVSVSILLLSWVTALGAVAHEVTDAWSAAVALAYPIGDVVVLTLVVVLLSRATADRRALTLVGSGVATIALADSAFLFLTSLRAPDVDLHLLGLGWATGFVLVGLGALAAVSTDEPAESSDRPGGRLHLLPYAPVLLAVGIAAARAVTDGPTGQVETVLSVLVVALVLLRQYALVRDHARLLEALAVREAELRHQAFHDGLTGLGNRALFRERVATALTRRERSGQPLTVLFCDLDGFKHVNDTLGHAAGDALLVGVAARLRSVLREEDTLARLGGDEFGVLLGDCDDPQAVAGALLHALRAPVDLAGRAQVVRMSVGATTVAAGVRPSPSVDALLAQADTAMYGAKRDGGGAVRAHTPAPALGEGDLAGVLTEAVAAGDLPLASASRRTCRDRP